MKRLFLCGTILLLILISCFAGFLTVTRCGEEFDRQLSQLQEEAYTLSFQQLADRSAQVALRWESAEQAMVRYLRRNCLDEVTGSMAKLEKLAQLKLRGTGIGRAIALHPGKKELAQRRALVYLAGAGGRGFTPLHRGHKLPHLQRTGGSRGWFQPESSWSWTWMPGEIWS